MARDIPMGNGSLLITHDNHYRLRDIYFPSLGKENHTVGHGFMFGIRVDGKLDWTNGSWKFDLVGYVHDSLVTDVEGVNDLLGVKLRCHDVVDYRENIYIKKVILQNLSEQPREFRIFFHHDFHIFENPAGDTAYYDAEEKALIHYKADTTVPWEVPGTPGSARARSNCPSRRNPPFLKLPVNKGL